ncbi:MAG: hypothetical protein EOL87_05850 [Spartobacteria bacterium]|nr:hypothetical protein [Spartobacteria bacterium]
MSTCECLQSCPFFNDRMKQDEGLGAIMKKKYCLGDHTACARYEVFKALGKAYVPATLFPNMHDQAKQILTHHGQ